MSSCGFSPDWEKINNMDRKVIWAAITVVYEDILALAKLLVEHNSLDDDCILPHDMADSYIAFGIGNHSVQTAQAFETINNQIQ